MNRILISSVLLIMTPLLTYSSGGGEPPAVVVPKDKVPLVQGNISIEKNDQKFPAANWEVTLYSKELQRSAPVYTGSDGMYTFKNIPPGNYILEIWFTKPVQFDKQLYALVKTGRIDEKGLPGLSIQTSGQYSIYWYHKQFLKMERPVTVESAETAVLPSVAIPNAYLETFQLAR